MNRSAGAASSSGGGTGLRNGSTGSGSTGSTGGSKQAPQACDQNAVVAPESANWGSSSCSASGSQEQEPSRNKCSTKEHQMKARTSCTLLHHLQEHDERALDTMKEHQKFYR
eukprot:GSA25T00020897001.1